MVERCQMHYDHKHYKDNSYSQHLAHYLEYTNSPIWIMKNVRAKNLCFHL